MAEGRAARANYPWWVKLSRWAVGVLAVLTALPYWLSIRWVDKHAAWNDDGEA